MVQVGAAGSIVGGRFQLLSRVATGGMGTVHRALDTSRGRAVAVKLVTDVSSSEASERFRREIELLADLRHPGIVEFIDAGQLPGGGMYMAMQWLEGIDLAAKLVSGPLGCADAVKLVRVVAEALSVAHDRGVVHRDVKPHNIFLREGDVGSPVLLDFGIAMLAGLSVGITRIGVTVGTPSYMAPEQARGERNLDARVDVYGLGSLLFQCISGSPPFVGPSPLAIVAEVMLSPPPRLSDRAPGTPPELDQLLLAMLAKDPAQRPRDGRAVAEQLRAIEASLELPQHAGPATVSGDERRLVALLGVSAPLSPAASDAHATVPMRGTFLPKLSRDNQAEFQLVPGGAALLTFTSDDSIAEAATRASHAALEIVRGDETLAVGMVIGSSQLRGKLDGEIVERVAGLAALPGQILADEAARGVLADRFVFEEHEPGFRVVCARGEGDSGARFVPFVGRDREVQALEDVLEAAIDEGRARSALVVGGPGLGKSRILRELFVRWEERTPAPAVVDARAEPLRRDTPLSLLGQIIRRGFTVVEGAAPAEQQQLLRSALRPIILAPELPRVVTFLALAAGLPPFEQAPSNELAAAQRDPQIMEDQIAHAFELAVAGLVRLRGSAAILVDDGQWADTLTVRVLARTLRALREQPVVLVVFARPEGDPRFAAALRDQPHERLQIGGLPRRAAERFVREALGARATETLIQRIAQRAEGNPLFLSELASFALSSDQQSLAPSTVLASLEARLLRLEPTARKILRAASVFGETFWRGGVAALLGEGSAEARSLNDWLLFLVEREIVEPSRTTRFGGETELTFRHALLRDAAYAMLTADDRARGHRRAAQWLAAQGEREPAVLASHYDAAGDSSAGASEWAIAGRLAYRRNDGTEAIRCCERALNGGAGGEDRSAILLLLATCLAWSGDLERASLRADEAVASYLAGSQGWVDAMCVRARVLARRDEGAAVDTARALVSAVEHNPTLSAASEALPHLVPIALRRGLRELAQQIVRVLGESAINNAPHDPSVRAHILRSRSWQAMFDGDLALCAALDSEALESSLRAGDQRQACTARFDVAYDLRMLGDFERSVELFQEARAEAEHLGLDALHHTIEHNLSLALHLLGRHAEAIEMQHRCIDVAIRRNDRLGEAFSRYYMGIIRHETHNLELAQRELERALTALESSSIRWDALARLSAIALEQGDVGRAGSLIEAAVRGASQVPNAEEGDLYIRLAQIQLALRVGDAALARAQLTIAYSGLWARAQRIPDLALREKFLTRLPHHRQIIQLARELLPAP